MPVYKNRVGDIDFLRGKNGNIIGVVFELNLESAETLRKAVGRSIADAKKFDKQDNRIKKIKIETRWAHKTKDPNGYASFCQDIRFLKPKA